MKTQIKCQVSTFQIANSKTDKELKNNLHHEDIQGILDAQGAVKSPVLQNKDSILKIILRHVLVNSTRYLLEDFKKGLETLGVLEAIQKHPQQFRELFTTESIRPLDATTVDSIFRIDFDEQASNRRDSHELEHYPLEGLSSRLRKYLSN